jgi:hypothetical protein
MRTDPTIPPDEAEATRADLDSRGVLPGRDVYEDAEFFPW